jgi:hypothetical protein
MAVLAPPVVRGTRPAQPLHLTAAQSWFKEYASHYTGQYIAVRGGTLLGSASTLQELHERIGVEGQTASTIVVKAYPEHPGPFSSHSYPPFVNRGVSLTLSLLSCGDSPLQRLTR